MYPISVNYEDTVPPSGLAVSLADVKTYISVDFNDDDALITALIEAATDIVERHTNLLLLPRTRRVTLQQIQFSGVERCGFLTWQNAPVRAVTAFERLDGNSFVAVDAEDYDVKFTPGYPRILLRRFGFSFSDFSTFDCEPYLYRVTYDAGYADVDSIPGPLKTAIMMVVNQMYVDRGDCACDPNGADIAPVARALLSRYITRGVFA